MRDLHHNVLVTQHLNPVVSTATKTSTAIDLQGYNGANIIFSIGQSGDTLSGSVYWTLKLQHSDDDSTYSDTAAADLNSPSLTNVVNSSSLDRTSYSFGYQGNKRYLKAVATPTGTHTNGTPIAIVALRGSASYNPVI
ncbi:MAG: hypothetical protein ABL867_04685 [Rickettsiales bacterium]